MQRTGTRRTRAPFTVYKYPSPFLSIFPCPSFLDVGHTLGRADAHLHRVVFLYSVVLLSFAGLFILIGFYESITKA